MPIFKMSRLLKCASEHKFAVGYFESFNMESTQAVLDAAEQMNSPVIIGFSGVFTNSPKREIRENIYDYGAMAFSMAKNARIPVSIILNEADDVSMIVKSLNAGFNTVMYQKPGEKFEETIEINKYLVKTAHYLNAEVESEVGALPESDISNRSVSKGANTDPDKAKYFVDQTGIDALAVAIGNIHLLEESKSKIDFNLLKDIKMKIKIPLVLHGGTGVAEEDLKEAIALGITKINIGTVLKRNYLEALKNICCNKGISSINPHKLIGHGGSEDLICSARKAIADVTKVYIKLFGSENKAGLI
jgi:ketose-bisphosphate aldolase